MKKCKTTADNRHEGLLDLSLDDADAFAKWYQNRPGGGHPWEICRGGNSTHISLQIVRRENGWQLYLAGFSTSRVVETAKMAITLFARGVPFILPMKDEMLSCDDFVGTVPDDIGLGYNHGDFPDEDRVYSFAYLWMLTDLSVGAVNKIRWYTVPKLSLCNTAT